MHTSDYHHHRYQAHSYQLPQMADTIIRESTRTLVRGLEKRKACDLCHIKKIKCDGKKPTCTHCSVYGAQCAYTPHIKKRRKEVKIQPSTQASLLISETSNPPGPPPANPSLPSLDVLLPRLGDYFLHLNSIIPIFDRESFMRMLNSPFSPVSNTVTPDPLFTAAIHAILALTYQHKATSLPPPHPTFIPEQSITAVETLTSNLDLCSQSPYTNLESTKHHEIHKIPGHDLLGLQVLLTYTIYHLATPRSGAVAYLSVLLGRIIKLVHRLELNRSDHTHHGAFFNTETSLQRSRLFWIAYILDRHISMNSHDPPLQQDDDLDVPIPISLPGYGLVNFTTTTGEEIPFDFLAARIHLAKIQGVIYSLIYSVRASNQTPENLAHNVLLIRGMLSDWLASRVPTELYPNNLGTMISGPATAIRELVALYFNYMFCLMHTHKVGHHHAEWIVRLVGYSQEIVSSRPGSIVSDASGMSTTDSTAIGTQSGGGTTWVSSPGWDELVKTARECARLFRLVGRDDTALLWMTTCAYITSSLVLVANRLTAAAPEQHPSNPDRFKAEAEEEDALINQAVAFLEKDLAEMPHPHSSQMRRMAAALGELSCRARIARAKSGLLPTGTTNMTSSAAVAWLENEARKSAGFSAIELVQAFTGAEQKTMATRMAYRGSLK